MPIGFIFLANLLLYVFYWVISSFVAGILYTQIYGNLDSIVSQKIGIFLLFLVAIVTLVFRKYFYIAFSRKVYSAPNPEQREIKKEKTPKKETITEKIEEGLKIKIEKEIK